MENGNTVLWTQFLELDNLLSRTAAFLLAITLHDILQTALAAWFGDRTARQQGRLSFNPIVHLDALGLSMLLFGPYGWSRKVPVQSEAFGSQARLKAGIVIAAGPLLHLILSFVFGWLSFSGSLAASAEGHFSLHQGWPSWLLVAFQSFIYWSFIVNIMLFIIHLFPFYPTDLWKAFMLTASGRLQSGMLRGERWSMVILIIILVTPIGRLMLENIFHWWSSAIMSLF